MIFKNRVHIFKKRIKYLIWKFYKPNSIKPPQLYKERLIRKYGRSFKLDCLVETGTYEGETIWNVRKNFKKIFTIELCKKLANEAKNLFVNYPHIKIYEGDSSKVLKKILPLINTPSLFWLDAHYSSGKTAKGNLDTPILQELKLVTSHPKKHIILVDDWDNFGKGDYPSLKEIRRLSEKDYFLALKNNILRLVPKKNL